MTVAEVFHGTAAQVVKSSIMHRMLKEENVVIADKKVADDRAYYILVDKTAIPENKEISIDCPKEVRGKFIGKNGKGVVAMIQRLARKGVIVRRVHFIEEDTDA